MKISIFLGITMSLLLLALPAAASDYTLGVFGNANEDDTINMQDVTYTELIILEYRDQTELADGKYDGKINMQDVTQIELIILGKEKELTVVQYTREHPAPDILEEPVTVPMPIEKIVVFSNYAAETICTLGAQDKIVGVDDWTKKTKVLETFVEDKAVINKKGGWDMEKILELNPDIVITYGGRSYPNYEKILNAAGIQLVQMDFYVVYYWDKETRNLGWMLNNNERAEELIDFEQQHFDLIEERVKDLEEEQKPRFYQESGKDYHTYGPGQTNYDTPIACGGISIFADLPTTYGEIDPEAVLERNPQVIIKMMAGSMLPHGYDVTDTGPMEELRNAIMSRPGWDRIDAVKNGRVYLISNEAAGIHTCIWRSYVAKWFHPELFEDVDPVEIHREWLETFLGIEYKGVYAYHAMD
ncbi:MAG: ABC transporter substrate-binding protein [Methanosarcinaceae archaeon]